MTEKQTGMESRLAEALSSLAESEAALQGDVRNIYMRLLQAKGGDDSLAPINGRSCQGCYTELTSQNSNDLRSGRTVA